MFYAEGDMYLDTGDLQILKAGQSFGWCLPVAKTGALLSCAKICYHISGFLSWHAVKKSNRKNSLNKGFLEGDK